MTSQVPGTRTLDRVDRPPGTDLSIVIVCWNNRRYLEPCLESIFGSGMRTAFEVVVVDNGSKDGSQEMVRAGFPAVRLIQNAQNVGLAAASNQGIRATEGRHVLLLNDDTLVNGSSLDAMVAFLDANPGAGAVGGRVLNEDGSIQTCHNRFSTLREEFLIATRLGEMFWPAYPASIETDGPVIVDWLTSACLALRRRALNEVGLLDEDYFIYGDEADLQFRLRRAGWEVWFLPDAHIIHYGGRTLDRWRRRRLVCRGKILFYRKNYGPLSTAALRLMLATLTTLKLLVWAPASLLPWSRERAAKELASNVEVLKLCCDPH